MRFLPLLAFILFFSCRSENEHDLFKNIIGNETCDTLYVNYNTSVKTIFDNKCVSCHQQEWVPGCDLDSFPAITNYISNSGDLLYTTVMNNDHQGAVLTTCEQNQLRKWILNPAE